MTKLLHHALAFRNSARPILGSLPLSFLIRFRQIILNQPETCFKQVPGFSQIAPKQTSAVFKRSKLTAFSFLLLLASLLSSVSAVAQVSAYSFAQSAGTYTPIIGGNIVATATANTTAGSLDNNIYSIATGTIPFPFTFNGTPYTGLSVSTNGFVTFGATQPSSSIYTPISTNTGYAGAISAISLDLNSRYSTIPADKGEIRYETVGTSPNREFVIQYSNFRPFTTSTTAFFVWNFQIRLSEDNTIRIVYDFLPPVGSPSGSTAQVGLRGATNLEYNNRNITATNPWSGSLSGTSNSATAGFSTTLQPPSGLTYIFTPPTPVPRTVGTIALQQNIGYLAKGVTNINIFRIAIPVTGNTGNLTLNSLEVSSLNTNDADITASGVKLWIGTATGTTSQIGTAQSFSGGKATFSGLTTALTSTGTSTTTHYLWVTYNTSSTAITDNIIGGFLEANSIVITAANGAILSGGQPASVLNLGNTQTISAYCIPTYSIGCLEDYIAKVEVNTLINASRGCNDQPNSYIKYPTSSFTTTLQKSVAYGARVTAGEDTDAIAIWIDLNQDGDFSDAGEFMGSTAVLTEGTEGNISITIPNTASLGQTQMRVRANWNTVLTSSESCTGKIYGETEDYTITIDPAPACSQLAASTFTSNSTTNNSTTVNWGTSATATNGYQVRYKPVSAPTTTASWAIPMLVPSGTSVNLSGLISNTKYEFQVQADCGNGATSPFSVSATFTTACDPVTNFPYTEGFETATTPAMPSCWLAVDANSDGTTWLTTTTNPRTGANAARIDFHSSNIMNDWLFSPGVQLVAGQEYSISFWYRVNTLIERLEVKWGTSPSVAGMTSTAIFDNNNITNQNYVEGKATFIPATSGIYYIGWHGYSAVNRWWINIDDITIKESPALNVGAIALTAPVTTGCYSATENISVTIKNFSFLPIDFSVNPTTVTVNVTGAVTRTLSLLLDNGILAPGITTNIAVGPLDMTTAGTYTFNAITTVTGDGDSSNDAMPQTTRSVAPIASLPQFVDFTSFNGSNLATSHTGWKEAAGLTPTGTTSAWTSSTAAQTIALGSTTARFNLFGTARKEWIIGPKIEATNSTVVKFNVALTENGSAAVDNENGMQGTDDKLQIMVSTDCGTTFNPIFTLDDSNTASITNSLVSQKVSLAAYAGQQIIVAFYATDGTIDDVNSYEIHLDDIFIGTPPSLDMGAIALAAPGTTGCYTANENISITIQNHNNDPIDFSVNPTIVTVNITGATVQTISTIINSGVLAAGVTQNVIVGQLDMRSVGGTYTFNATATVVGDGNPGNDAMLQTIRTAAPIAVLPQVVDFTGFTGSNLTTGFPDWKEAAGAIKPSGTSSAWTSAATIQATLLGSVTARLNFTTSAATVRQEWIVGPKVAATATTALKLKAAVTSVDGNGVATMLPTDSLKVMVSTDCGESFVRVGAITGNNNLTNTLTTFIFNLSSYAGQDIIVALVGKTGTPRPASAYDLHIDDIFLGTPPSSDLGISAILSPGSGCGLSTQETIAVTVSNFGADAQTNIPLQYSINGGAPITEIMPGPLAPGVSATYTFTTKADFSIVGTYTIAASTTLSGDVDATNNAASATINSIAIVATFPYLQDFENGDGGWATGGVNNSWALGTPASTTINSAASGTKAWKTKLSGSYNNNEQSYVVGPCFNFSALANPVIELKIWWSSEFSWDGAVLQSSLDGGHTWQKIGAFGDPINWYNDNTIGAAPGGQIAASAEGWTGTGTSSSGGWVTANHDLTGLGGQSAVMLRVAFGSDNITTGDGFAFDDISIYEKPNNELQLVSITAPVSKSSGCGFTNAETVTVTVKNNGSTATSTFDLKYEVSNALPVIETVNMVIASGATGTYSFATKADMSVPGSYTFTATVIIPGDGDPLNNSSSKTVNVNPTVATFPYLQNFENGAGGWTAGGSSASWALGTPAGTVINSAASGSNAWKTNLTGTYNNSEQSFVVGPCFNFSSLVKPTIELSIWWITENNFDKAALQSSIDGGATWQHVGAFGDPNNWYNNNSTSGPGVGGGIKLGWSGEAAGATSGGWVTAKHELTGLGGQSSVLLRIAFGSDGGTTRDGFAFDDILIKEGPALNMGAIALATPLATGCYSANEPVTVTIQNFGVAPIDFSINPTTVTVNITGATTATLNTTVTTGMLAAGATQHVFVDNLNMLTAGNYIFNATATVAGDGNTFNDAMPQVTRTVTPIAALPQAVDFNSFTGTNLTTGFPDWKEATGTTKPGGTSSAWTSAATTQATSLGSVTARLTFTTTASTVRQEWIVGPKVTATPTTALKLKAAVTSSGGTAVATMLPTDSLKVMVSTDCGENFVKVGAITGSDNLTNSLTDFIFDLSAYNGQNIIVALMGKTGTPRPTIAYDLHVDDLFLGTPPTLDIDAVSLALATSNCYSASEPINVTILNSGPTVLDFSINPVTVTVNVTGAVTQTLTNTINTGTLAAGATQNVFVDNLNMRVAGGTYTFNGTATVAGDGNISNDAMQTTSRTVIGLATLPQNVNFTNFNGSNIATLFAGWSEATGASTPSGTGSEWSSKSFGNISSSSNGAAAHLNIYSNSKNEWLIGPKVNPTITTELRFDLALTLWSTTTSGTLGSDDEFKVMISTDCGSTYTAIRTYNASTPISNTGQKETISLAAYAGQDIRIAFFASEGSVNDPEDVDLFLDNIFIGDCTPGLWSGQVSTDWNTHGNWSCNTVPAANANVTITTGVKNYPQISSGTAQANNVTIATGASVTVNGGTLQLAGNLTNSGTFTNTSGALELTGLNGQVLSGITALANLTVNGSGTKTISGNLIINNALTMTAGLLNTENSKITLVGPALISESNTSYVLGQVETTRDLSAATMADFGGMGLQLTPAAGSVMPGLTTARRVTGTPMNAGGPGYSIPRYFDIQSAVNANLDVTMVFHYLDHEVAAYNEANLVLYRSGNQGGSWAADSATVADPVNNLVRLFGIAKFSYWTAGDINAPLPVELIAFNATKKGNDALLTWTTASETNSKGFEVQVSSNSFDFRALGFVESRNSATLQQYSFTDAEKGKNGTRYYRLKQIDFDGTISYSSIRAVNFQTTATLVNVYPNPFSATFNLAIESAVAAQAPATITDLTGKTVWEKQLKIEQGENQLKLDAAEKLPAGIYLLHLQIGTEHFTTKLIKQ